MMSNNLFFMLVWELRRWKEQRGKAVILVLGFSLLCTLLSVVIASGNELFFGTPDWAKPTNKYATLTNQHANGELSPVNKVTLLAAKQQPYVKAVSWFSVNKYQLKFELDAPLDITALWFSEELPDVLNISADLRARLRNETGVWLTEAFWRSHFNADPDVIGKAVTNSRLPQGAIIKGVLPANLTKLGNWTADVWLSGSYLAYKTPFSTPTMVERFLLAAPQYYGVIEAEDGLNVESLRQALNAQDLTISSMSIAGNGSSLKVFNQINFDPQAKTSLYFQFNLLLLLVICLGVVLSINTFTLYSTHMIIHRDEYRLQRILGSSASLMCMGPVLLSVVFVFLIFLVSSPMILFANRFIAMYQANSGVTSLPLKVSFYFQLPAVALVSLLFLASTAFNFFPALTGGLYNRAMNSGRSLFDKVFGHLMLTVQLAVALTSLILLVSLYQSTIANGVQSSIDQTTIVQSINLKGIPVNSNDLVEGNTSGVNSKAVALSKTTFDKPFITQVTSSAFTGEVVVRAHYVSKNYFDVLGAKVTGFEKDGWYSGVVINETAKQLIQQTSGLKEAVGQAINIGVGNTPLIIEGVVEDVPHLGNYSGDYAMIYLLMNDPQKQYLHLYSKPADQRAINNAVDWVSNSSTSAIVQNPTTIKDIISGRDALYVYLLSISSALVLVILLGVLLSLNYQLKSRLKLEQQRLGVILAIGAPSVEIFKVFIIELLPSILMAVPLSILMANWAEYQSYQLSMNLVDIKLSAVTFSSMILLIVLLLLALKHAMKVLRTPIQSLLKAN